MIAPAAVGCKRLLGGVGNPGLLNRLPVARCSAHLAALMLHNHEQLRHDVLRTLPELLCLDQRSPVAVDHTV